LLAYRGGFFKTLLCRSKRACITRFYAKAKAGQGGGHMSLDRAIRELERRALTGDRAALPLLRVAWERARAMEGKALVDAVFAAMECARRIRETR
jgi:hypothetical protein